MSIGAKLELIADAVYEKGKQAGELNIYNMISCYGTRTDWVGAFKNADFSEFEFPTTFKPQTLASVFSNYAGKTLPKNIDFSEVTEWGNAFRESKKLLELDLSTASPPSNYNYLVYLCAELKKLTINSLETTLYNNTFGLCSSLEELTINGWVGNNLSLSHSKKLSKNSISHMFSVLSDNASGKKLTLSLTAVQKAFETTEGANDGNTSEEWLALVASKSNWTITLS